MDDRIVFELTCYICKDVIKGGYSALTFHFRNSHLIQTSKRVVRKLDCAQNGCTFSCNNFSKYYYHLKGCVHVIRNKLDEASHQETNNATASST
jgi:hypothetical protein